MHNDGYNWPPKVALPEPRQLHTLEELQRQAHVLAHAMLDLSQQFRKHLDAQKRGEI